VERRWIVGALVTAAGALDRSTGIITVIFSALTSAATRSRTLDNLLSLATLATLGPGPVQASWFNASTLHLQLPPAHLTGICIAWRASRSTAIGVGEINITFRDPATMFEPGSGDVYGGEAHVHMGATEGSLSVFLSGPRDVGGCQQLQLDAGRMDGSWDGVLRWTLESSTSINTTAGTPPRSNHDDLDTLMESTSSAGKAIVSVPPNMTSANTKYTFAVRLTNCHGNFSESKLVANRFRGMVPGRGRHAPPLSNLH
jgi:hypothetical protein